MDPFPAVEANIRERISNLEQFEDDIVSCRVTVEVPHKHRAKGKLYHVVVDVRVPGWEVVVSHDRARTAPTKRYVTQ